MNNYADKKTPLLDGSIFADRAEIIFIPIYILAIAIAEMMSVAFGAFFGFLGHAVLLPVMLSQSVLTHHPSYRRGLPVLALVPLLRILSLTMPVREVPQTYWYVMIGVPLLLATALTTRLLDLGPASIGLQLHAWRSQILIALSGVPLSIVGYLIAQTKPIIPQLAWQQFVIAALSLTTFSAFTEELIFRGVIQQVLRQIFGKIGIVYAAILFTAMYIGSMSLRYLLFIALVGLFFSWCADRTRTIWGVIVAHSILNIGMLLIWPFTLR